MSNVGSLAAPQQQQQQLQLDAGWERLEGVRRQVESGAALSTQLAELMRGVDGRLSQLERDVSDVHRTSSHLQLVHNNIDAVLDSVDRKLAVFDTAASVQPTIRAGLRGGEVEAYVQCLDRVGQAISYLTRNKQFKSSSAALAQLKELRDVGVEQCEQLFGALLVRHSIPLDPARFGYTAPAAAAPGEPGAASLTDPTRRLQRTPSSLQSLASMPAAAIAAGQPPSSSASSAATPGPAEPQAEDEYALIRAEGIGELKRLVARFVSLGASKYIVDYADKRVKAINSALRRLSPDKMIADEPASPAPAASQRQTASSSSSAAAVPVHPFASCVSFYLCLLTHEAALCAELINDAASIDRCLSHIIEHTSPLLLDTADSINILKKSVDKGFGVFVLLELWSRCSRLVQQHHQLLMVDDEKHFLRLTAMVEDFAAGADKCLEDFDSYVRTDYGKQLPPDGTVHELTSNACVFLKRLYDGRDALQELRASASTTASGAGGIAAEFTLRVLLQLSDNLAAKAKREKKQALANVFMLNNLHYIDKTLRSPPLSSLLMLPAGALPCLIASTPPPLSPGSRSSARASSARSASSATSTKPAGSRRWS
eukprot:TRINITY_DN1701_c0_g1_i6.p1 TRINITY_DN1701_c0_g1~~TRINITY_DN1701_c0_g1_i6.p1  ORF type:complete len:599 (-),score=239.51 TRINITY_DN1701_c0_g1_i6:339-2135(-)